MIEFLPMKTETEITAKLIELRHQLKAEKDHHKEYKRERGLSRTNLGKKNQRVLEGKISILAWIRDVPDPGPTPTVQ